MKTTRFVLFCMVLVLQGGALPAVDPDPGETKCPPGSGQAQEDTGICADPGGLAVPLVPGGMEMLQTLPDKGTGASKAVKPAAGKSGTPMSPAKGKAVVYLFWGRGCPHCEKEKHFLEGLQRENPALEVRSFEVWYDKKNAGLLASMLQARGMRSSGVPVTIVDDQVFAGFTSQTEARLTAVIKECGTRSCVDPADVLKTARASGATPRSSVSTTAASLSAQSGAQDGTVDIPLLGTLDPRSASLPMLTLFIAGMDSFNPCAFFVLLSLLGLLVHARSRNKMLLVGGVFVFFSGFIYFLFMAAWLNLFLVMGQVAVITTIAGVVSLIIAAINIKDFFLFKQGVSLSIPDSAKPGLFDRMRKLMRSTSLPSVLVGTTVLAIVANSYELLCTAGFPMVFTRILTLNNLPTASYYLYLVLYNIVYVVPLSIIVVMFTVTLGSRKLTERQGRVLKLVSGAMMLGLGGVLLVNPALLNSVVISFTILAGALGVSLLVATVTRRLGY
jgi:thiol-disulfide isomerase/thioredoxin